MRNYGRIMQAFKGQNWAICPEKAEAILAVLELRAAGGRVPEDDIRAAVASSMPRVRKATGMIAVMPLLGTLANRTNMMTDSSGGTSMEAWGRQFDAAVNDPAIGGILIDVDSPGGTVAGTPELSQRIFDARSTKPIYAIANAQATSAAYWIGSSASKFFASPSAEVGSVGVVYLHEDQSEALAKDGYKLTIVRAGRLKAESNSYEPLSDESRSYLQSRADADLAMFIGALARNRGMRKRDVAANFGEGRVFSAADALKRGMVDGIATLDEVISMMTK